VPALCSEFLVCDLSVIAVQSKGKGKCIYIVHNLLYLTLEALRHVSHSLTCNYTNVCLYLVSVHQIAPPQTDWGGEHLIAAYYSFIYPERMKGWIGLLADLQQMVYSHKWSPVSCKSSAGQGKFAGQRPTFCHCTMQQTSVPCNKLPCWILTSDAPRTNFTYRSMCK